MSIWQYQQQLPPLPEAAHLTLNEGQTPCEENPALAKALGVQQLWLKREDANPTGSHKDRSLAYWLSVLQLRGEKKLVISSSGNAAISAVYYTKKMDCTLDIFLTPRLPQNKRVRLAAALDLPDPTQLPTKVGSHVSFGRVSIHTSDRAVSDAFRCSKEHGSYLLRGSTDPLAIPGLMTMAWELIEQAPQAEHLFIPSSSGTTAVGLFEGYQKCGHRPLPRFHIVQTTAIDTLVREFVAPHAAAPSLASAITDRIGHRQKEVAALIRQTHGSGWVVSDQEVELVQKLLDDQCLTFAPEGALALAAIRQARQQGVVLDKVVAVITGR